MSSKGSVRRRGQIDPSASNTGLTTREQQTGLARGFDSIFDQFRSSLDDMMRPFLPIPTLIGPPAELVRFPLVDLEDKGDKYTVSAELPGFTKDMVDVQVNKDGIVIAAEKKSEEEERGKNYLHRERAFSSFRRSIAFPEEVAPSKVDGSMKDGVLELTIPKKEPRPEEKMTKVELK